MQQHRLSGSAKCTSPSKVVESDLAVNPEDILLWPDAFWCFREEYSPEMGRDAGYRVILHHSPEWSKF